MTKRILLLGVLALFVLLIIAGSLGQIGPVELWIWLGLVAVWVAWWTWSRRRDSSP
jgi:hypothetical protein